MAHQQEDFIRIKNKHYQVWRRILILGHYSWEALWKKPIIDKLSPKCGSLVYFFQLAKGLKSNISTTASPLPWSLKKATWKCRATLLTFFLLGLKFFPLYPPLEFICRNVRVYVNVCAERSPVIRWTPQPVSFQHFSKHHLSELIPGIKDNMERKTGQQQKKKEMLFKRYQTTAFSTDIIYSPSTPKYIWAMVQECENKTHRLNIWSNLNKTFI